MVRLFHCNYGTRRIAEKLGRERKTVRAILREEGCDPAARSPASAAKASKLDPYREAVKEKVEKRLTTTRILREIKERGYPASLSPASGPRVELEVVPLPSYADGAVQARRDISGLMNQLAADFDRVAA